MRELELVYARAQLELEVSKAQQLAEVEVKKFKQMTEALGPSTIRDLAVAGPEMQVRVGEKVQVWACVDVCACGCVSWGHVGNQEDRAREANTSREMLGTERQEEVAAWRLYVSHVLIHVIGAWGHIRHCTGFGELLGGW